VVLETPVSTPNLKTFQTAVGEKPFEFLQEFEGVETSDLQCAIESFDKNSLDVWRLYETKEPLLDSSTETFYSEIWEKRLQRYFFEIKSLDFVFVTVHKSAHFVSLVVLQSKEMILFDSMHESAPQEIRNALDLVCKKLGGNLLDASKPIQPGKIECGVISFYFFTKIVTHFLERRPMNISEVTKIIDDIAKENIQSVTEETVKKFFAPHLRFVPSNKTKLAEFLTN
jgi:hypothetical protein